MNTKQEDKCCEECEKCTQKVPKNFVNQSTKDGWVECIHTGWYCPCHSPSCCCNDEECDCCYPTDDEEAKQREEIINMSKEDK